MGDRPKFGLQTRGGAPMSDRFASFLGKFPCKYHVLSSLSVIWTFNISFNNKIMNMTKIAAQP